MASQKELFSLCRFLLESGVSEDAIVRSMTLYDYETIATVARGFKRNRRKLTDDIFYHHLKTLHEMEPMDLGKALTVKDTGEMPT